MEYNFEINKLKLYLLSQSENNDYDTYDSCVVCSENEDDAKTIRPDGYVFLENDWRGGCWANHLSAISCEEIGIAKKGLTRGVICASFNNG